MGQNVPHRTPFFLIRELVKEVECITADMLFMKPRKPDDPVEYIPMKVFGQALPIAVKKPETEEMEETIDYVDSQEEDPVYHCPWAVIRAGTGECKGVNANQTVHVAVGFGIYNDNTGNMGHQELLNLIQRVYERFAKNPLLAFSYTCACDFEWAIQEEDTYPYYFGAIGMSFEFPGIRRESLFV